MRAGYKKRVFFVTVSISILLLLSAGCIKYKISDKSFLMGYLLGSLNTSGGTSTSSSSSSSTSSSSSSGSSCGAVSSTITISGCSSYPCAVTVTWAQNRDKAVTSAGGGYKIYWKQSTHCFDAVTADGSVDAGQVTSRSVSFNKGTWYVRVSAYGTLLGASESALSDPMAIVVE